MMPGNPRPQGGRTRIDVHVIDAHRLFRSALVHALNGAPDMRVGVSAGSVDEFAASPKRATGAVVIVNLRLPGTSGADAVTAVNRMGFRVLAISVAGGQAELLSALAAGSRGCVGRDADIDEVRHAVRQVAAGRRYLSPVVTTGRTDKRTHRQRAIRSLSERERQVLALLAAGERDREIADRLSISVHTVRSHIDHIRQKTGHRRRPDLTRLAIESEIFTMGRSDEST